MTSAREARHQALERLVADVAEPVRRYLARRTDPDTAEDVLAEVLLVCWRRSDDIPDEPLPWVYGVTRNCLANARRGIRRRNRLTARIIAVDPPRESDPEQTTDDRVGPVLDALRPADAELLRLWAWEQLSPAEIGTVLGISANAASIRLHRAREKFKDEFRKTGDGDGHEQVDEGRRT